MSSNLPTAFPSLLPAQLNQAWFPATDQLVEESVITRAEDAYEAWRQALRAHGDGIISYGKVSDDNLIEHREESSGSDNSSEDDLDTDVLDDQDSLHDVDIEMTPANNGVSPVL